MLAISVCFFACMSGCGYEWRGADAVQTISIPYVCNDEDGSLTAELIRTFVSESYFRVIRSGAKYRLEASIVHRQNDEIGYQTNPQKIKGKIHKNLVDDQARKTIAVDVTLFDEESKIAMFGPCRIEADEVYDYVDGDSLQDLAFQDSKGRGRSVLEFSLGQLEPSGAAQEAALRPLYKKIARKIAEAIASAY